MYTTKNYYVPAMCLRCTSDVLMKNIKRVASAGEGTWLSRFQFRGRGKPGSILGAIMLLFYLISTFFTLFGIMALTSEWELLWYIHPLLMIPGCFIALLNKKEK